MQVVLTDQDHILPLTEENLHLNFPATAHPSQHVSTHAHTQPDQAAQPTAQQQPVAATQLQPPALPPASSANSQQQQQPMSAAAAFEAAFGAPSPEHHQQQGQDGSSRDETGGCSWENNQAAAAAVFAAGPLVLQYSWGEPLQMLQDRLTAAAAGRMGCQALPHHVPCDPSKRADQHHHRDVAANVIYDQPGVGVGDSTQTAAEEAAVQQDGRSLQVVAGSTPPPPAAAAAEGPSRGSQQPSAPTATHAEAPQHAASHASQQSSQHMAACIAAHGYDVVVGADLLYDPAHHAALLLTLQQLAAASPHVQVYLCWRQRQLGEEAFLAAAAAAGWVIEDVPVCLLHPEFQDGCYQIVRMVHLP
jgi:hypothetical protein